MSLHSFRGWSIGGQWSWIVCGMEVWMGTPARLVRSVLLQLGNVVAVLVSISIPSWGTAMEIFYAHSLGIPVIGWNPEEKPFGPWLKVHCKYIFSDFYNIKLVLQNLLVKA